MGCGASSTSEPPSREGSAGKSRTENVESEKTDETTKNGDISNGRARNKHLELKDNSNNSGSQESLNRKNKKNKSNKVDPMVPAVPVPRAVAFDVSLDNDINNILYKKPPKRLTGLEPLTNAPRLTAEALQEKMRLAEEKRQRLLEKKKATSRKTSKLRRQLTEAKLLDKTAETNDKIEEKQRSAGKNRESKQRDTEQRKLMREERAKRARERARKMQDGDQDLDLDIEKDETYNDDDNDSWLGDGEPNRMRDFGNDRILSSGTDRVYSGRESPHKSYNPRSSAEMRARASAFSTSTADSFDYAFQRDPTRNRRAQNDDFFDS